MQAASGYPSSVEEALLSGGGGAGGGGGGGGGGAGGDLTGHPVHYSSRTFLYLILDAFLQSICSCRNRSPCSLCSAMLISVIKPQAKNTCLSYFLAQIFSSCSVRFLFVQKKPLQQSYSK